MTRRTSRLTAESLEQRAMMAADMTGLAATIDTNFDDPNSPTQQVAQPVDDFEISSVWVCGTNTKFLRKSYHQAVDAAFTGPDKALTGPDDGAIADRIQGATDATRSVDPLQGYVQAVRSVDPLQGYVQAVDADDQGATNATKSAMNPFSRT